APVAWTLHDLWPLNGRRDYPDLSADGINASVRRLLDSGEARAWRKELAEFGKRLSFVAPSKWMCETANIFSSAGFGAIHIANGVDISAMHPVNMIAARSLWNLPSAPVVGVVAQ